MRKVGSVDPGPIPDTSGMTDDEFCRAISEHYDAVLEDVVMTKEQIERHLMNHGKDPAGFREIMLAIS